MENNANYKMGLIYTFTAFLLWGFAVLFFKQVAHIPPFELIAHRSLWSLLLLAIIITITQKWTIVFETFKKPKIMITLMFTSLFILANWSLFIWAILNGYIIESSLGYFINPLLSVLLGVLLLKEKLSKAQIIAILLASLAIIIRLVLAGTFPWIALTLAFSFATYGYLRKTVGIGATEGLFIELFILLLPILGFLYYLHITQGLSFLTIDLKTDFLIVASGVVTAVPLLLFSTGARIIKLSTVGLLQYIAPSLQFLIGLYYGEAFTSIDAIVFGLIWTGLIIYSFSGYLNDRNNRPIA